MDNKKLLVFSDSHGSVNTLKTVFKWANDHIPPNDTICTAACLGDGLSDIRMAANATGFYSDWKLVLGNNDYGIQAPEAAVFDLAEHRFFMCHGHRQGLYGGYHTLLAAAKNNDANAALFGHSHVPFFKIIDGISLINPGSVGRPRSRIGSTFAVIECIEGGPINVEFFGISAHNESIRKVKI
ncbi:MAG: YfcE family phosphodiesterase [Treponema sp.]|nr:YfcE family phosphodiesterase [Treponema sp.]